jgi:predicted dehydrogenase
MISGVSRRLFLGGVTAASYSRILGANDRVGIGFMGYGLIGAQHVYDFKRQPDAELVAMSEVYGPRMDEGAQACGGDVKRYPDFRKMLDDSDIDAVVVALPDHWHAMASIMACAAGKDVYVEKPMTLFIREGEWMIKAADKYRRVIQVGTQQRSGLHYDKARKLIQEDYLGKVHTVRMASWRNVMPGFGRPTGRKPDNLDYEMWLGPAPKRPYLPHRSLYHFRWYWDYSGGQMTNLAAHHLDILVWYMKIKGAKAVNMSGGRFVLQDDGETPDTIDATFEFDDFTAIYSCREASVGSNGARGQEFFGTKGSLTINRGGFEVHPDVKRPPENAIPQFRGGPSGAPPRRQVKLEHWMEPVKEKGHGQEQFDLHARNFLDCIKSREKPIASVEEGHKVAVMCHLANISYRTGRKLRWDAEKGEIIGDQEASKMMERPYRAPWDQVLRSLI